MATDRSTDHAPSSGPIDHTGRPVLPVGFPLGMAVPVETGVPDDQPYEIRLGEGLMYMAEPQYKLWLLAMDGRPRAQLVEAAAEQGIESAEELLPGMFRTRLLVELEDDPAANESLFEHLRLHATGIGMGNSPEDPTQFRIGLPGLGVRAVVDMRVYEVWSLATRPTSLAERCRELTRDMGVDPRFYISQIAVNLQLLLHEGVAYLDVT